MKQKITIDDSGMWSQERAQLQTVQEWLLEYETGEVVEPRAAQKMPAHGDIKPGSTSTGLYDFNIRSAKALGRVRPELKFDSHKTTSQGRLLLMFIEINSRREVVAWFNVSTQNQRKIAHKSKKKTGLKGYFYPAPRSKFRKFWEHVFGDHGYRWGGVYRSTSRLKKYTFTGDIVEALDGKGNPYYQVNSLRKA